MSIETMKLALEALKCTESECGSRAFEREEEAITALLQAIEQAESYPPECQTDAEKTAYAFGWWKALEVNRNEQSQPVAWVLNRELFWPFEYELISQNGDNAIPLYTAPPPQRLPLTEWQPIETAPDETEVFIGAFIDGVFKFGRSVRFYEQGNEFEGETWRGWVWSIDDCSDSVAEMPTHWMPLPSAPIETTHDIKGSV